MTSTAADTPPGLTALAHRARVADGAVRNKQVTHAHGRRYFAALATLPWLVGYDLAACPRFASVRDEIDRFNDDPAHVLSWIVEHPNHFDVIEAALFGLFGLGEFERLARWLAHTDPAVQEATAHLMVGLRRVDAPAARQIERRLLGATTVPPAIVISTARCLAAPSPALVAKLAEWSANDDQDTAIAAIRALAAVSEVTAEIADALTAALSRHSSIRRAVAMTCKELGHKASCMLGAFTKWRADAIMTTRAVILDAITALTILTPVEEEPPLIARHAAA